MARYNPHENNITLQIPMAVIHDIARKYDLDITSTVHIMIIIGMDALAWNIDEQKKKPLFPHGNQIINPFK